MIISKALLRSIRTALSCPALFNICPQFEYYNPFNSYIRYSNWSIFLFFEITFQISLTQQTKHLLVSSFLLNYYFLFYTQLSHLLVSGYLEMLVNYLNIPNIWNSWPTLILAFILWTLGWFSIFLIAISTELLKSVVSANLRLLSLILRDLTAFSKMS